MTIAPQPSRWIKPLFNDQGMTVRCDVFFAKAITKNDSRCCKKSLHSFLKMTVLIFENHYTDF
jgi:hypothetical protein